MAEVYWHALARDVSFEEYETNQTTIDAASDLSKFSDFRGPKDNGLVTRVPYSAEGHLVTSQALISPNFFGKIFLMDPP
ncbi:hypothetical protein [Bacillus methanolicus]|uniref:hypothetical protein n=1 Tax=Bacillus methanolicus TaxID=1471 RepID=UPI002380306F|nr:hypothetical protein [Bacillus methanolicus]